MNGTTVGSLCMWAVPDWAPLLDTKTCVLTVLPMEELLTEHNKREKEKQKKKEEELDLEEAPF